MKQALRLVLLALLAFSVSAEAKLPPRSAKAKHDFQKNHPCPSTGKSSGACPGYVKDHVKARACGGADSADNMQWQTTAAGKAKDRVERKGCGVTR